MPIEIVDEPLGGASVKKRLVLDNRRLLFVELHIDDKDRRPYFSIGWPSLVRYQEGLDIIRSSYQRLRTEYMEPNQLDVYEGVTGPIVGCYNDNEHVVISLDEFMRPPSYLDTNQTNIQWIRAHTEYLTYWFDVKEGQMGGIGYENLSIELAKLHGDTFPLRLRADQKDELQHVLDELFKHLPRLVRR